ncbi:hypothetical protein K457DRAFT_22237 [Linnemannia elongata AG-77]|uniref:Uncharacterized protein n=1 Tax=Linnemannia elongata AG-77 TaxID=1314771 RepID=A0A197JMB7_9FUNG|nr:hypothetical protein K457DRAFT_22237 [Linnemannia elongata AG-77]
MIHPKSFTPLSSKASSQSQRTRDYSTNFKDFHDNGITHLIIGIQCNGGVTTAVQNHSPTIAQANSATTSFGLYGPHIYLDLSTNKPYTTNSLRNATYSHFTAFNIPILPPDPQL